MTEVNELSGPPDLLGLWVLSGFLELDEDDSSIGEDVAPVGESCVLFASELGGFPPESSSPFADLLLDVEFRRDMVPPRSLRTGSCDNRIQDVEGKCGH